jgi:hypothetical protein
MLNRMEVTKWTVVAATGELVVVGLVLLVRPQLFARLAYGAEFSDAGKALGWLTGIALLVLALATWPTPATTSDPASSLRAPLAYNLLTTIHFIYVGISGGLTGILLWPAVARPRNRLVRARSRLAQRDQEIMNVGNFDRSVSEPRGTPQSAPTWWSHPKPDAMHSAEPT